MVRDALMQPVRKVLSATHFKPTGENGGKWTPCSPGDLAAVEKTWTDIGTDELQEPPLKLNDFIKAIDTVRPTVTEDDIKRHVDWTNDSGIFLILSVMTNSLNDWIYYREFRGLGLRAVIILFVLYLLYLSSSFSSIILYFTAFISFFCMICLVPLTFSHKNYNGFLNVFNNDSTVNIEHGVIIKD